MAKNKNEVDAEQVELISMTKDGEQIEVCAAQVTQHEALGWQIAAALTDSEVA
jgi:hypothetical protein